MRQNNLFALIGLVAILASCAKMVDEKAKCTEDLSFEASLVDENTRTQLDGTSVLWSEGDKIMVYQGTFSSGVFTSTASAPTVRTTFQGSLSAMVGAQESTPGDLDFWAVYPDSLAVGCDGASVTLRVNSLQQGVEGSFAAGTFPSVARSSGYALAFYNVCGGVKFTVAQSGIMKVTLRSKDGTPLAGTANVSFENGLPKVNSVSDGVSYVTVNAPSSIGFVPGKDYFLVALPAVLAEGFTIEYENENGKSVFSSSSAVQIKRRIFAELAQNGDCNIIFKDGIAKAACVNAFDKDGDGEVSFNEAKAAILLEGLFEDYDRVEYFPELVCFTGVRDLTGCCTDCSNLKEVNIPEFIESIGDKAFYNCTSLANIIIPASVKKLGGEVFRNCTGLEDVMIENGLEEIGSRAFYNTSLEEIRLPSSVKSIGSRAFGNETLQIILDSATPPEITSISFGSATRFFVPDASLDAYKQAENWCEFEEFIFPQSGYKPLFANNLSADGTANCYIVSEKGTYAFKAVKGNSNTPVGDVKGVKVLWESFGTDVVPSVGDLVKAKVRYVYTNNFISFSTNDTYKEGNAVIAAYSDAGCTDGNVLWSWHIWMTDKPQEQIYFNNAGTMMDRNLGATSATPGDVHALGLLYQWGRKDPFLGANRIYEDGSKYGSSAASTIIWPLAEAVSSHLSGNTTLSYSISNPTTFLTVFPTITTYFDWYCTDESHKNDYLWKDEMGDKTIYDPCPTGWRIPEGGNDGVWEKAFGTYESKPASNWDNINMGMDFGKTDRKLGIGTIWYPGAGYYNTYLDNVCIYYISGIYWSCSTPKSYLASRSLKINRNVSGNIISSNEARAHGCSVRCIKE